FGSKLCARDRQHRGRAIDAGHVEAGAGDRKRDAAGAARELEDRTASLPRLCEVELDVAVEQCARAADFTKIVEVDARPAVLIMLWRSRIVFAIARHAQL